MARKQRNETDQTEKKVFVLVALCLGLIFRLIDYHEILLIKAMNGIVETRAHALV
jgi:hypothetical protein